MKDEYVKGTPYFTAINKCIKQYPYLTENKKCDVVIVGGGITGAILGYYFAKNNIDVVIIEKERVGLGSTSITTALLQYELDSNCMELKNNLTEDEVALAYKLGLDALDQIELFIKENGNRCNFKRRDSLLYTDKKVEIKEIQQEYEFRLNNGLNVEFITENNNPYRFSLKAGVYSKNGGAEVNPYLLTDELLEVAIKNGLNIYENTEAKEILNVEDGIKIITNYNYEINAKKVIIATGYNKRNFTKECFGTMTNTFNIVTRPIEDLSEWYNNTLIRDNKDPYHYFRTTVDNRIIAGGEDVDFESSINDEKKCEEKYAALENKIKEMFPNLNIEVEYKYCGAFIATNDNLGYIGPDIKDKNKWYCLGYGANGILFAVLGGKILTQLYNGEDCSFKDLFKLDRKK